MTRVFQQTVSDEMYERLEALRKVYLMETVQDVVRQILSGFLKGAET
jgi:hypothetical protein